MKSKNPCLSCDCWDSDAEGCTMPHSDKWYACPIDSERPENKKALENAVYGKTAMAAVYGKAALEAGKEDNEKQ